MRGTFRFRHVYAVARQRLFKEGPGEQIMTNEVRVNVTRGGGLRETGLSLSQDLFPGQTEGHTHRKYITADANHVCYKCAAVTYKEILGEQ